MQNKMKRFRLFGTLILLILTLFIGFKITADASFNVANSDCSSYPSSFSGTQGYTLTIGSVSSYDKGRTWSIANTDVAVITGYSSTSGNANKYVYVELRGIGSTTLTGTCNGESDSVTITSTKFFYFADSNSNIKTVSLYCGSTSSEYETYWADGNLTRTWESSNSNIAYASGLRHSGNDKNKYGKVTAGETPGNATITISCGGVSGYYVRYCYIRVTAVQRTVYIAYNVNGGTVGNGYKIDGTWVNNGSSNYFHSLGHHQTGDPYNASTFGLTRTGYTFGGWKVNSTGTVLNQDTNYSAATYAQYNSSTTTTANTNTVYCHLYAVWNVNSYNLDVNPKLDGTANNSGISGCTFDVYINGSRVANDVIDYCTAHPYGTTYEIKDFKSPTGKSYTGQTSYSGTIGAGAVSVTPTWVTNTYTLDVNPKLDGTAYGSGMDGCTFDVYINGTRVSNDVKDYCTTHAYGTTYKINDFKSPSGKHYTGNAEYSGTITATTYVEPTWALNTVQLAYNPNGGTVSASGYGYNTYGWVTQTGVTYFHTFKYGETKDPYNASTFGLTRAGYTFGGWKVDSTGTVLNQDTAYASTVYAHYNDSSKTTANTSAVTCYLYAVWNPVKITAITITGTNWCYINETTTLTATPTPSAVADSSVTWTSSDTSIATVANGVVTGKSAGSVTITATANDGSNVKGTYTVTVKPKVTNIKLSGNTECFRGQSEQLTATIEPSGVTGVTLQWSTSNANVASLSTTTGTSVTITGGIKGSAEITCTAVGTGVSAKTTFTVKQQVTEIQITSNQDWLWVGETLKLTASTIKPSDANLKTVSWSTSDKNTATISSDGTVTGVKAGKVTITCTANDGYGTSRTKEITVRQQINNLSISGTLWCWVGKTSKLTGNIEPSSVYNSDLTWSSNNTAIATVNAGTVTGVKAGACKITVTAGDGKGASATVDFEVRQQVTNIVLTGTDWCWVGKSSQLTATIEQDVAPYNSKIDWSSSNTNIATVTTSGKVNGIAKGTVTITAKANDNQGAAATMTFTVKQQVTEITLSGTTSAWVGESKQLSASIKPTNPTPNDSKVNWTSSDATVATVNSTGKVTALKSGKTTITCTANDGYGTKAEVEFIVYQQVTSIEITGAIWCYVGDTTTLTATCLPDYSYNKTVSWTSSDTSIATIDKDTGLVKGVKAGDVIFTATAKDGQGAKQTFSMTIFNKISGVVMSTTAIDLFANGTNYTSLSAYTTPTTGTRDSSLLWKSNSTNLVTVQGGQDTHKNSNAAITLVPNNAGRLGSTTIVASAYDDTSKSSSTTVNLIGFKLNSTNITMFVGGTYTLNALKTTSSNTSGSAYSSVKWAVTSGTDKVSINTDAGSSIIVTANKEGTATVTATATAGNTVTTSCTIVVKDFVLSSENNIVEIFAPRASVNNPETATLKITYDASVEVKVAWTIVSGGNYATLSATTGDSVVLTPKSTNKNKTLDIKVRATTTNASANVYKEITIKVKQPVDTITLGKDRIVMFTNTTYTFNSNTMSPDYAYNPNWSWNQIDNLTISNIDSSAHGLTIKSNDKTVNDATLTATANDKRGATDSVKVDVRKLSLNTTNLTMYQNSTFTLNAYYTTTTDANKQAQSVAWEVTSGKDIVSISKSSGSSTVVSANTKTGTATIKATATEDTSTSLTCNIVVKEIKLSVDKDVLYVKESNTAESHYTTQAYAKVDSKDVAVTWTSSNTALATVNASGVITGISTSSKASNTVTITATIAATANSAEGKISKTITLRQQVTGATIKNTSDVVKSSIVIYEGSEYSLKAIASPSYAYNKKLNWKITGTEGVISLSKTTSDSSEAVVVKGLKAGNATIEITANDGYVTKVLATCAVKVKGLSLKASVSELFASRVVVTNPETVTLYSYVDGELFSVDWEIISGGEFATLDTASGYKTILTPKTITTKTQTVTIRGTTNDGDSNIHKDITVTLKNPVNKITLGKTTITMYTNTSYTLTASIDNAAYNTDIEWTIPNVLTGKVSSDTHSVTLTAGNQATSGVTVTATAKDGRGATASATVIIKKLYLSATKVTLYPGATYTLSCLTTTSNDAIKSSLCTNTAATWSITSGSDIISLSTTTGGNTVITANKTGSAVVKAVPNDNNGSAISLTCNIVVEPLTVSFSQNIIYVKQADTLASKYQSTATATATTELNKTWSSSNTAIATVNASTGLIEGISTNSKSSNTAVITATATPKIESDISDYKQTYTVGTASKTIEVRQQVTNAGIYSIKSGALLAGITVYEGTTHVVKGTATPSYAFNSKLNWTVVGDNFSIDQNTTNSNGTITITGLKAGTAYLQLTSNDGVVTKVLDEIWVKVKGLSLTVSSDIIFAPRASANNPETTVLSAYVDGALTDVEWTIVSGEEWATLSKTTASQVVLTPKVIPTETKTVVVRGTTIDGDSNTYKELTITIKNPVDTITVPDNSIIMYTNTTLTVNTTINNIPYNSKLNWTTSSPQITISDDTHSIVITAGNEASSGNVITATADDGRGATVSMTVDIRKLQLSATDVVMTPGSKYTLQSFYTFNNAETITAADCTALSVNWKISSGTDIVSISKTSGNQTVITALKAGKATITATASDNTSTSTTCNITVYDLSVTFGRDLIYVKGSETAQADYRTQASAIRNNVSVSAKWTSANADIAEVGENNGLVTGIGTNNTKETTTTITAAVTPVVTSVITDLNQLTVDGTASKKITVRQQVTAATIQDSNGTERTTLTIYEDTTFKLKAISTPSYAYNTKLNWSVVGNAVALSHADSASGELITVTGVAPGDAVIQVTANDDIATIVLAECAVHVKGLRVETTSDSIFASRLVVTNPEIAILSAYVDDELDDGVVWTILDGADYITLSATKGGQITLTPKTIPTATQTIKIRASTHDGDVNTSKDLVIELKNPVNTITLSDTSLILFTGTVYNVTATVPSIAYNQNLTWTAPSSVSINSTNKGHKLQITAGSKPATTQTITVKANDNRGADGAIAVAVKQLYLSNTTLTMYPNSTFELSAWYTYSTKDNGVLQPVQWEITSGSELISLSTTSGSKTTISAHKAGTAKIKATATEHTQKTVECTVTVKDIVLSFGQDILYVKNNDTDIADYTTTASAKVDNKNVTVAWESSDTSLLTIDKNSGAIVAISTNNNKSTTVTITATIAATSNSSEGKQSKTIEIRQQVTDAIIQDSNNVERTSIMIYEGMSFDLKAIAIPDYAYNTQLKWNIIGNDNEISIEKDLTESGELNEVTGWNPGTATIQITSDDGYVSKVIAECEVRVVSLSLTTSADIIFASRVMVTNPETAILTAYCDGVETTATWKIISGGEFATLEYVSDSSVKLIPKTITNKTEKIVIRGTATNADSNTYKDITVTLKNPVDNISLSKNSIIMFTDTSFDITASINTVNPYNKILDWTVPAYPTVQVNDDTYAIKITTGSTPTANEVIIVTANDGRGATASVNVAVKKLYLNTETLTMNPNSTFELSAWYTYSTKDNGVLQSVKWEIVDGSDIISISNTSGNKTVVTGLKPGTATIKATATENTTKSIICPVTVEKIILTFDKEILYVKEDNTDASDYMTQAYAKVNDNDVVVTWESSDPSIATIDRNTGVITAISTNGKKSATVTITATIAATANSAEGKEYKTLEVRQQVTGAEIMNTSGEVKSFISIYEQKTYTLKAIASPDYAFNKKLDWKVVGDEGIVSLNKTTSESGESIIVTGLKLGTVTLQVTSNDGYVSKVLAECTVQVKGLVLEASAYDVFASRFVVTNPEPVTLFAYVDNVPATVTWEIISGGEFATLSSNSGETVVLTPKTITNATEKVVIRGTSVDADVNAYKEIEITLKNPIDKLALTDTSLIMFTETNYNVDAAINTANPYNRLLDWSVPTYSVLTISENTYAIKITTGTKPTANEVITVTANDGRGAIASINVAVKQLYLNTDTLTMNPNSTFELSAWYTYSTMDNGVLQPVKWEIVDGSDVISISTTDGAKTTVSAHKAGTATIKATATEDTTKSITCAVKVETIVLSFDKEVLYVKEDNTNASDYQTQAYAKINGQDVEVTWTSSNPAIATIDKNTGVITGISTQNKKSETVTITATIAATPNRAEGKQYKTIEIRQQVTDAIIQTVENQEKASLIIYENETYQLKAIALPDYAYNTKLNWKVVGDEDSISLSKTLTNSGEVITVTGLKIGNATIQITSNDGYVSKVIAECEVQVKGLVITAASYEIFASRLVVSNPEPTTLFAHIDDVAAPVVWTIISGGEFATLSSDNGSSVILTPKTITNPTEKVVIRGTTIDADSNTYKEITVTLKNPVDTLELTDTSLIMFTNTTYDVTATITNNSYNKLLDWSTPVYSTLAISDNTYSIKIKTGKNPTEKEVIIVTANDGRGATASIDVAVKQLYLNTDTLLMYPNSTFELSAWYTYSTMDNGVLQPVVWEIVNGSDVVSISDTNGAKTTVSAHKAGTATIQATATEDTQKTIKCDITVKNIVVSFNKDILYVEETNTIAQHYTANAYAKVDGKDVIVTWESADTTIATVDKNTGVVTGINTHNQPSITVNITATIAATPNSAEGKQTKAITIRQQVTDAVIQNEDGEDKTSLTIYQNHTYQLMAISYPEYAHNEKLNWKIVGEDNIIDISKTTTNSGELITITGVNAGYVTLQVFANDGIVTKVLAECGIRVKGLELKTPADVIFASRLSVTNPEPTTIYAYVDGVEAVINWEIISGGEFATLSSDNGMTVVLTPKTIVNQTEKVVIRGTTIDADVNTYKDITITLKNPVDTIELSDYEVIMYTNTKYDVDAMITNDSYNKKLNWSKPSISAITVKNDTHRITITAGEKTTTGETITVTANDNRGATNTLTVIIRKLLLSADTVYMTPGSTFKLSSFYTYDTKNFKLDNCTSLIVDWDIISGEDVVSISQDNGADVIVTGLKAGTAVIQITTIDGDANTTTTCEITVQDISVSFDQDIIYVKEDYSIVEKYQSVAHAWIAGEEVPATWTSADSNLATIDYDTGAIVGISTDENPEITVTMTGYVVPVIYSSIEGYEQVTTTGKQVNDITIRQQVTASIIQNLDGEEKQSLLMYKDETYDLIAIALPSYSHNMKLNWEIVGEGVIEISKSLTTSGEVVTVSAIGIGTSKIEITSNDGIVPKVLATCDVRVKGLELKASHYDIFASRHVLLNPESTTLSAFADGIESEVMWEIISGQEFATLASDRGETMVLTAKTIINSTEDIIIRATTIEADANTHKDIIVTLKNPVDTIELSDYDVLLYTNTSYDVDAMITNNSYNKALNWSKPSISSIAVSRDTHRITITAGEKTTTGETITVTANDGRGATNTLTVVIRKLVLSADSVYMTPGSTVELGALYTFDTSDFIIDNCVNLDVDWKIISGEDVIKLSSGSGEKITVTGLKAGTAVVQATTIDGDANTTTTCTFVVQDIAISFDQDIIYVKEDNSIAEKYQSVAHAWIEGVEVPATWTSADSNLATIDYDTGAIVGISTDENPEITVTMTGYVVPVIYSSIEGYEQVTSTGKQINDITIRQQVTSAVIQNVNGEEKTSLLMYEYETYDLVAVTAPTYAHNNKVNWSVIGSAVKVMKNTSASGEAVTIQALTAGTATIQITSNDGVMPLVLAECQVRVKNLTLHADDYSIFASRVCVYNPQRTTLRAYVDGLPSEDVDWKIIVGYNYADLQESSGSAVTLIPRTMVLSDFILVIRATTTDADANTSKTINITVKNPVETISLSDYEVIMYTNTSCNVDATISNNAFNKLLDWSTPTITGIDISEKTHTITINAGEQTTTGEVITVDANDGRGATNSLTVIVRKFLLSAESAYITPGSTFKLSAMYTFDTSDFTIDNCTPLSSNWKIISGEDIVSISSSEGADIIVTGLKAGTAVIEATAPGDATTTLRCEVTVQDIAVTFDQDIIYVKEDNSIVEKYLSVAHAWIAGEEVPATWTSADSNLVTIDYDTGDIVGISTGEEPEIKVTITGYVTPVINSYVDGYEQVLVDGEQTNDITVRQQVTSAIICDDTDRNRTSITIYTGTTYNLKAIVSPEYSHNKKVNWTILSDHAELSHEVSESGEYIGVTGLKPGITTIQIVSNDGVVPMVLAECEVIVKELSLNYNSFMIYTDGTITLRAYSKIYGTVDQSVTWSIDDTDVATLDRETGEFVVVTGGKGGNTYITATTTDADANTSMQCEVIIKYVLLEIDKDLIYVEHPITDPNNYTINARALVCEIPTDCRWEFTTMDSLNSTVTQNGIASHATLIGVDTGTPTVTITITVTTIDATEESGNISDSKTIEVRQQAYNIYPERNHLIMYTDTSYDSYTTIGPDYIFDRTTVWEVVDGEGVVEIPTLMPVEDMGKVTINAVKGGNATIRISANDRQGAIEHLYVVSKHLTLSHTDITIFKGDTLELTAFANGNPNEVIWSVGDESVVKIAENKGYAIVLEPQEIGETTITAETFDADINIKLTTSIRVLDMRVEAPINEIYVGEQTSLTAFINYVPETVKWTVSDSSVATISEDNNGTITVTGVSSGEVEIVAESIGYTVNGKRSMKIRVLQHVTDIKLDKQDILLYVGGTYPFGFTVEPGDADTKSFATYLANYSIIAGFSDTDNPYVKNLTGNRVGKETFYVAANDKYAFTTTGTVTVKNLIIPEEITVEIGSKYSLTAYAATTNAQVKQSVIWRVEGDNISIDTTSGDTVQITGNAIGTAKLYATTTDADGNVTKVCNVRVSEYAIHVDTNVLYTGETMNAYVTINGTKTACTWTSSDENVITVSGTGSTVTVNAIGIGKATITATAPDGYTMEASVEVKQAVESIELNKTEIVIYGREKHSFTATINPMNATDMNIQITHTDASLMLLSKSTKDNVISFEIAPLKAGEDIITLTAADGKGATASIRVVIKDFDIDLANNVIYVGDTVTVNALISNTEITATENVVWSIGDSTIASLDAAAGLSVNLTGNSAGETTLTATTVGGDVNRSVSRTIIVKQAVESITLDRNAITMTVNSSAKLNIVSILPATATNKNVTWQNSNSSVVSLYTSENSATLVASKVGTATITVVANDGKGASATCVVTVEAKDLEVSGLTMYVDSQATVKFNTDLIVGWDGIATWTSSDESIVKIVSNEMNTATLKAISAGEAVVTATTAYHNGTVTGTHVFNITVKEKLTIPTSLTLYKGTTYELSAGDVEVQWKSEHVGYVACTKSFGKSTTLQALNVGTTKVIATVVTADVNVTYACTVTVKDVSISCSNYNIWIGETASLSAMSGKEINENVVWSANNDNIKFDKITGDDITVTGLKAGTTVVTVTTVDGDTNTSVSANITVKQPVTKLTMKSDLTVFVGSSATLTVVAMPSTATTPNVIWSGYDESIVSVETKNQKISSYATITGLQSGTTTITATAADGQGASATCNITVIQKVSSITLPQTCIVYVGKTATLDYTVLPAYAENTNVEWISSDSNIATVNATTGLIKGISAGTVKITCKATDGSGVSADCLVTVIQFVTNITLDKTELDMYTNYADTVYTAKLNIAKVYPENASNVNVKWESDKPEYITVDDNGLLTVQVSELPNGLTYETVTITCIALDGSGVRARCTVTLKQSVSEVFIIDYEKFFVFNNGMITGLTDYAYEKLKTPNIAIEIPSIIGGETVVEIGEGVFKNCDTIRSITVPSSVMYIGSTAFEDCDNLTDVYIMSSKNKVVGVPWGATNATIHWLDITDDDTIAVLLTITAANRHLIGYTGVNNETLVIPEHFYDANGVYYKVVAIGDSAFANCNKLTKVVLPDSVTKIEANAFSGCSALTEITLSENIRTVGDYAFSGCSALKSISFSVNIKTISQNAFNGCTALRTIAIDRYYNEVLYGPWGAPNATVVWKTPA